MIGDDLNLVWAIRRPDEAHSILIVDPDAVLPPAIPLESFQPVAPQSGEIGQLACSIDHAELLESLPGATLKAPASARRE